MKRWVSLIFLLGCLVTPLPAEPSAPDLATLQAQAEQGDAKAQVNLGKAYYFGEGVGKDPVAAVKWFRLAAEQGNTKAQFNLGFMYAQGEGVAKDLVAAVKWYRLAAEKGNAEAQYNLGAMYAQGLGVGKDPVTAVKWTRLAAEQGIAPAQYNLGVRYAQGLGVGKDPVVAVKWYRLAAEQGNAEAQYALGAMYAQGLGVGKDPVAAAKWVRLAAEQGIAPAQYNLGVMYARGEGVLKDEVEALAWFNLVGVSGDEQAQKARDGLEHRLGPSAALAAQQRAKKLQAQIAAGQTSAAATVGPQFDPTTARPVPDTPKGSGTGAIISPAGYVLTAAHVVAGASRITALTQRGPVEATVVRVDEANDLAVLKLAGAGYAAVPVAPSRGVRLGQAVATLGFPNIGIQGFSPKVTRGEISSHNGAGDDPRNWQISVPVQPGNSGGPLLDAQGNLIGVVESKLGLAAARATDDLPQNVGYAVKSAYALALLEPYLTEAPEPIPAPAKPEKFEDMVSRTLPAVVLILVY